MSFVSKSAPRQPRNSRLPVLALLLGLCLPAFGQSLYFPNGLPDGIALLPPPPARGSAEEAADLDCVRAVCKARTTDEEAHATKSASLAFSLFAPAIGSS